MLKAGYDVKLASGVITAGGTLGILIPPSVMIIVYAAVAGQSVVKLYAAAMFPGFFLSLLYLVYILGWAMINPKDRAEAARRAEQGAGAGLDAKAAGRVIRHNMPVALRRRRWSRRRKQRPSMTDGKPLDAWMLFKNFCAALIPLMLIALMLWAAWWYVVIHQQAALEAAVVPELRATGARRSPRRPRRRRNVGPPAAFYYWFWGIVAAAALMMARYYSRLDARSARGHQARQFVGDAARHSDRRRARRDPVRHHDGDGICRCRRRRRVSARVSGADAGLEAHQGSGVPDGEDHRDGVLAVRRVGAVLGGVRDSRRSGIAGGVGARRSTCRRSSS